MVISAVLPPSTGWGFEFSSPSNSKIASSTTATPEHNVRTYPSTNNDRSLKRKASFPDRLEMDCDDDFVDQCDSNNSPSKSFALTNDNESFNSSFQKLSTNSGSLGSSRSMHRTFAAPRAGATGSGSVTKRARTHNVSGRRLPILRVVESLDRKGLQNLIESICQSNPQIADQIVNIAPRVTVSSAIDILKKHADAVYTNMPYKGNQRGDYAYLRVRPAIEEFYQALSDYTAHFLPPNESQPSNTLGFLDDATTLLHKLPTWSNPINNHQKNAAYDDISSAWVLAIKEASKRAGGLGLAHGGWEYKLQKHNEASGGDRLLEAVECIQHELSWLSDSNNGESSNSSAIASSASAMNAANNSNIVPFRQVAVTDGWGQ